MSLSQVFQAIIFFFHNSKTNKNNLIEKSNIKEYKKKKNTISIQLRLRKESVLITEVLTHITLSKSDNGSGLRSPRLNRRLGSDTKTKGMIIHGVNNNTGMLWHIFAHATHMGLENVVTIQEGHLTILLDPDLKLGVLCQQLKGGDVQTELAGLGEFADTGTKGHEVVTGNANSIACNVLAHIVNTVLLNAEAVRFVSTVDEVGNVAANVVGKLLKNNLGFVFG